MLRTRRSKILAVLGPTAKELIAIARAEPGAEVVAEVLQNLREVERTGL